MKAWSCTPTLPNTWGVETGRAGAQGHKDLRPS